MNPLECGVTRLGVLSHKCGVTVKMWSGRLRVGRFFTEKNHTDDTQYFMPTVSKDFQLKSNKLQVSSL